MDDETLMRLALKMLNNRQAIPTLVDLHPMLADLANVASNPSRKWPQRLLAWCECNRVSSSSLEAFHAALRTSVSELTLKAEEMDRRRQFEQFAGKLKGVAYSIEQALKFDSEHAARWLAESDLPAAIASMPKPKSKPELKVTA